MLRKTEKEIQELQTKIDKLNKEKQLLLGLSPEKRVAELIHERLCSWNHTDGCAWFYENWDDFNDFDGKKHMAKGKYYKMAGNLLEHFTEEQIELFIELIPR